MAITLTAGESGAAQGYTRTGNAFGFPAFGSISAEPIAGLTLDVLISGSFPFLSFLGNQSATLLSSFTVNGATWAVGTGSYDSGSDSTGYPLTPAGGGFVNGAAHTVDMGGGTPPPTYAGPTYVGKSTANGNAAGFSIDFSSSGRVAGDKLYIAVETANQAITAPAGFTQVATYSPQSRGTAAAVGGVRLTLFERTSDGTETTVAIADSGDHQYAVGVVLRGRSGAAVAIEAGAGNNVAAATACTFGGVTTAVADCMAVTFVATDRDSAGPSFSGEANASLANLTERHDAGTTAGQGGGIAIYTGEKATAGATGNTTATQAASAAYCWITLAFKNAAVETVYKGEQSRAVRYVGARTDAQIYVGAKALFPA